MEDKIITKKQITDFEAALTSSEKSRHTIEKYTRDIRHLAAFSDGRPLDRAVVLEYKAQLEKGYALTSANSMLAAVNAFFRFAGWPELCVRQFKVQRTTYCSEERELTKQEYVALIRAAERKNNERLSLLIQTICGTGIRVSELEFITAQAVRCGEALVCCKGKRRKVFIVKALCGKLLRYAKQQHITSGPIFITSSGSPMNRSNIWREMKALCRHAGVSPSKVFPHNLRHLFARTFYSLEKDIAKLADILGHESINTTRIYIITTGAEHRRKLERMHLII